MCRETAATELTALETFVNGIRSKACIKEHYQEVKEDFLIMLFAFTVFVNSMTTLLKKFFH